MPNGNYYLKDITVIINFAFSFIFKYFGKYPSPFDNCNEKYPVKKKLKIGGNLKNIKVTDLDIVSACYTFLKYCPVYFKNQWKWTGFIEKFSNHEDDMIKW